MISVIHQLHKKGLIWNFCTVILVLIVWNRSRARCHKIKIVLPLLWIVCFIFLGFTCRRSHYFLWIVSNKIFYSVMSLWKYLYKMEKNMILYEYIYVKWKWTWFLVNSKKSFSFSLKNSEAAIETCSEKQVSEKSNHNPWTMFLKKINFL